MTSYEILEEIESIKYKISDLEYKKILDLLMKLNKEEASKNKSSDISLDDFISIIFNINPIFHNTSTVNQNINQDEIILNDLNELSSLRTCKNCRKMLNLSFFNFRGGKYNLNCNECLNRKYNKNK